MLKIVIGLVVVLIVGLVAGVAGLAFLGESLGLPGRAGAPVPISTVVPEPTPPEPLFYDVQTWFEFTPPAARDSLGEVVADELTGLSILPPEGLTAISAAEVEDQALNRPQSSIRLGDRGFDTDSIVWMLRSEDGGTLMTVRSKPHDEQIELIDYEEVLSRYSSGATDLVSEFGVNDVTIEGAIFRDGLGIYTRFIDPGPPESLVHTVQVMGLPSGNVITVTYSRSTEQMPPDWESIVQASIESLTIGGQAPQ